MKIIHACCLFFLILFSFESLAFHPKDIRFDKLTIKDGLIDYEIRSICQDRFGFLWIGSNGGLQKFDGTRFTNFQYSVSDSSSISSNNISCIFEDSKGRIWVGTYGGGFNYFIREKNIFIRYNKYKMENNWGLRVHSIVEDYNGNIWVGTQGGLYKLNLESQQLILYRYDSNLHESLSGMNIFTLCYDKKTHSIYAGTSNGLNVYNEASDNFINSNNTSPVWSECELLKSKYITNLFCEDTAIWASTITGEILLYNRYSHTLKKMNASFQFSEKKTYEKYYFVRDTKNNLWISSYSEGLRTFNSKTGEVETLRSGDSGNKNGLLADWIHIIFKDKDETLWICTGEGVNFFNLKRQFFEVRNIFNPKSPKEETELFCLATGMEDELWLGTTNSGLYCYHLNSNKAQTFLDIPNDKMYSKEIWDLNSSDSGFVWIGSGRGLFKLNFQKKTFEKYDLDYLNGEGNLKHDVIKIYEDRKKTLWIMTWDGPLMIFDKNKKKFLDASTFPNFQWLKSIRGIYSITEDNRNRLWFGSQKEGLFRLSRENGHLEKYHPLENDASSISSDQIYKIYESSDHSIWIGTMNNFLNKYNEQHNSFIRFGQQFGIQNAEIQNITEDKEKNLWLGTSKGLCLLNLKDSVIRNFNIFDGLPENNVFSDPIFLKDKCKIVYAFSNSLVYFEPERFKEHQLSSPVRITNIKLYDKLLANAEASGNETQITLEPKDNFVSIEFTALDFLHSDKIRYSYKLTAFNYDWIDNGDKRFVSFSNLAGGNYTFMVKCINADGVWSKPATLQIVKRLSFSQTVWFRLLISVLIILIILAYVRLRITGLRKQKIHLENMVNLRTQQYKTEMERAERSEKYKEEFLANMSHEIRTPMNAVVGLSNLLIATPLNEKQKNYLNAIRESSVNLMVILNDILDSSKIEAGKIEFEKIEFNLKKVLKNVEDILRLKSDEKGLFLKTNIQPGIPFNLTGDPTRLNQVLMNLVGNAIKFTEKGGVTITIEKQEETAGIIKLLFRVSDTGIGISAENREKIFESFTQEKLETTRKFGGTGLGLSISKKLVELQGGEIGVKSFEGKGSEFYFNINYEITSDVGAKAIIVESDLNPSEFNGLNVLIVEDNEFNQMVAMDTLLAFNKEMNVEIAENGMAALDKVMKNKYHVILMDIQMPDMDGYMVTQKIRNVTEGVNYKTPIIAMTANASKMEIEKCFAASMNEYVSKPFDPVNLFQKIYTVLNK